MEYFFGTVNICFDIWKTINLVVPVRIREHLSRPKKTGRPSSYLFLIRSIPWYFLFNLPFTSHKFLRLYNSLTFPFFHSKKIFPLLCHSNILWPAISNARLLPHKTIFSFLGVTIIKLHNFLETLELLPFFLLLLYLH